MRGLSGKNVVVIGGSSGTGLATAREAADLGASVLVTSSSERRLDEALSSLDGDVSAGIVDLTDDGSVEALFEETGRVDHLVVTASPTQRSGLPPGPVGQAHAYMEGKFWGSYRAAYHARERMAPDGSILFVSGRLATRPSPGSLMTTCAFAATEALGRALAVELAPIRANTVRLGTIDSPMWEGLPPEARRGIMEDAARRVPAGRAGRPEDVGAVAVMLMLADYVTGAVIDVDGGMGIADPY